jgi:hypothetical protein
MKSFSGSIKGRSSELNLALAADWWNLLQALRACKRLGRLQHDLLYGKALKFCFEVFSGVLPKAKIND